MRLAQPSFPRARP